MFHINIKDMITLSNLHEATAQEVFDQVATHLLKQGEKSLGPSPDGNTCYYRCTVHPGNKCAAGVLISDEEYREEIMESNGWNGLVTSGVVPGMYEGLIRKLQHIHDNTEVVDWPKNLMGLAKAENLNTNVLTNNTDGR